MDIALAVEKIILGANYLGSVTANTPESWEAVVWGENYEINADGAPKLDKDGKPTLMPKPTWAEIEAAWAAYQKDQEPTLIEQIQDVQEDYAPSLQDLVDGYTAAIMLENTIRADAIKKEYATLLAIQQEKIKELL